jgi:hypothetical protein
LIGRSALPSRSSAIDDCQEDAAAGNKKPSLRRVVQECSMAASVCRHERTNVEVIRDFAVSRFE